MLQRVSPSPRRVLMTLDAVGGVWRYAMDLGAALGRSGIETVFVGLGPAPGPAQRKEAERIGSLEWFDLPLDWMADGPEALRGLPDVLSACAARHGADLLHLNLPSQAHGLDVDCPVVVVSHSCVVTWWQAVRGGDMPAAWAWQKAHNRSGFDRADAVLAPSASHAALLRICYGPIERLQVVANATGSAVPAVPKEPFVFAAGRWWDEGKNGSALDRAAPLSPWPVIMAGATRGPNGQSFTITHAEAPGEMPHAKVRSLMGRAGIVASPSRFEPFGLAALEGAQTGAALVLSDIATYREYWDGAALFAHPDRPDAFAAAIARLAEDPELRTEMGQRALVRATRFSAAAQADAMLAVYAGAWSGQELTASE